MADGSQPYGCEVAAELLDDVLERFLRYARIDTQSDRASRSNPSTEKQLDLSRLLADELRGLGLDEVEITEHGYVFATLPAVGAPDTPSVGLIAHVDTSPDAPGTGVEPQVWRDYDGGELVLPGDPTQVLGPAQNPLLAERAGHDIVTSDGTTLLGADDKAGVAEIMAAAAWLLAHPDVARARARIGFTVDEEVGHGTDHFDLERFGADFAYTLDGQQVGRDRERDLLGDRARGDLHRRRHPPRLGQGAAREPGEARRAVHREPAAGHTLARDDRGARGLRPPVQRSRAARRA